MEVVSPFARILRPFISTPSEPKGYTALSAAAKQALQLQLIHESAYEKASLPQEKFPSVVQIATSLATHVLTFDHDSDFMPALPIVGQRERAIHTHGVIAAFEFVSTGHHDYTGLFKTGALGMLRTSNALPGKNLPGIGALFFIDGRNSAGFVGIHELAPQKDGMQFLDQNVTNVLPDPKDIPAKLGGLQFSLAKKYATKLSASNLADVDRHGNVVANPNAPYQIFFEPTAEAKKLLGKQSGTDIRADFIEKFKAGTHLYDVYALTKEGQEPVKIGEITTTSDFVASRHGDKNVFIRHNRGGVYGLFLQTAKEVGEKIRSAIGMGIARGLGIFNVD